MRKNAEDFFYDDWIVEERGDWDSATTNSNLEMYWRGLETNIFLPFFTKQEQAKPEIRILPRNAINHLSAVSLHVYTHERGSRAWNDIAEILETNYEKLEPMERYPLQGLFFEVLEKTDSFVTVHIQLPTNLLAYNLICTAQGQRLSLVQGAIEVEEYHPEENDIYSPK